ncbi:MAG TPA: low temperature requirement protein A [Gaiellaceae bacterium]|nr:low temperature requirement protein A [Gaiellaceae bacterium]
MSAIAPERNVRVSTLELFFDLVFVFTITQLTSVLVEGASAAAVAQVVVMLLVIWWMYDGYAWLTNAIATDHLRHRLLLIGGMGAFLVMALAIPSAYSSSGVAFALGYLAAVLLHAGMYARGTSLSEVRAILRIVPFSLVGAVVVLAGGAAGGDAQWVLWGLAAALLWFTPWLTSVEGFVVVPEHFVERHGLVIIVALGESIVVIGAAAGLELDAGLVLVVLLALGLSASLWWVYFSDEGAVERAMVDAPAKLRPRLAIVGFGYWHYGLLLAIVVVAAGLKKAVGDPYDPLASLSAVELAAGVALFLACQVGFRRTLGIGGGAARLVAAAVALVTIPLGTELDAKAQIGALVAIVVLALVAESVGPMESDPALPQQS